MMLRTMLKSKIHRATVTEANVDYEGSISIDTELMDAADLLPHEKVDIWDTFLTRNINVHIRGHEEMFIANLWNRRNLAQVLRFLDEKGIPLSSRAKAFMAAKGSPR